MIEKFTWLKNDTFFSYYSLTTLTFINSLYEQGGTSNISPYLCEVGKSVEITNRTTACYTPLCTSLVKENNRVTIYRNRPWFNLLWTGTTTHPMNQYSNQQILKCQRLLPPLYAVAKDNSGLSCYIMEYKL